MKVTILGGGGFVGSHLSEALLAEGHQVTVFDKPGAPFLDVSLQAGAKQVLGDFSNPEDLRLALSGCDIVYHLISTNVPATSNEDPILDAKANLIGSLQLLEEAKRGGVRKIVFASSGGTVYGVPREIPIGEDHPTEPISAYGISKLAIEKYLQLYWILHQVDYVVLRIANAYGERGPTAGAQGVIGSFMAKGLQKQELVIWGDGSVIRDYIHVMDVVDALSKAATYDGSLKVFNIGGGQGHSLNDIVHLIEHVIQQPLEPRYLRGREFDVPINVLDISRAREHLGWQPAVGLLEGIHRTHQWLMKKETT